MNYVIRATALTAMAVAITAATAATASAAPAPAGQHPATTGHPSTPAHSAPQAPAPVDPGAEYLKAFDTVAGGFGNDSRVGSIVGTVAGLVAGCGLGAVTGGTITIFVSAGTLTPLGAVGGCLIGADILGFVGSTVGSLVTGGPGLVTNTANAYNTLHAEHLIAAPIPRAHA